MEKNELLSLLAEDDLERALLTLESLCEREVTLRQEWINLSGRFQQLLRQERRGTASLNDLGVERNQIREALQALVDQIFNNSSKPQATRFIKRWGLLLSISMVLGAILIVEILPVREVSFQAIIKCTDVNFRLATAWPQSFTLPVQRFNLGPLQEVKGTNWQYQLDEVGQVIDLSLDSGKADLGPLYIAANELLGIRCRAGEVSFTLGNQASGELNIFHGELSVEPALGTRSFGGSNAGDQLQWTAEPGAQLTFAVPVNTSFQTPRLAIQGIEFIKKEGGEPSSAILSAKLNIKGQESLSLESADFLELGALQEANFSLRLNRDTLEIKVEGSTNSIKTGHQKLLSRKPSLFKYFRFR